MKNSQETFLSDAATHKDEWKGLLTLIGFLILCCGAPFFLNIYTDSGSTLGAIGAPLVWAFNIWLFGYKKILSGGIILFSKLERKDPYNEADLKTILQKIAKANKLSGDYEASIRFNGPNRLLPNLVFRSIQTSEVLNIKDAKSLHALINPIYGKTSRWQSFTFMPITFSFDLDDMSAHDQLEAAANLHTRSFQIKESIPMLLAQYLPKGKDSSWM